MASKVKGAIGSVERILLPRLNSIDGELKVVNTRIDGTNTRIDTLDTKVDSLKSELRTEMASNKNEIKADIRALSDKIDILPRLAILEAQMKEMQRKG
jgi:chromosome segregation ATPase